MGNVPYSRWCSCTYVGLLIFPKQETYKATPEEVAYFMKRIEMDDTFLSRCDNIEDVDFTIQWSPEELFDMEVN